METCQQLLVAGPRQAHLKNAALAKFRQVSSSVINHLINSMPATSLAGNAENQAYCLVYKIKMEETSVN